MKVFMGEVTVQFNLNLGTRCRRRGGGGGQPYAVAALPPRKDTPVPVRILMGLGKSLVALQKREIFISLSEITIPSCPEPSLITILTALSRRPDMDGRCE